MTIPRDNRVKDRMTLPVLLGLLVLRVSIAEPAILSEAQLLWCRAFVLRRRVVAPLAIGTSQGHKNSHGILPV